MVKLKFCLVMANSTKVISKIHKEVVQEFITIKMEIFTMVSGTTIGELAEVVSSLEMGRNSVACLSRIRLMATLNLKIQEATCSKLKTKKRKQPVSPEVKSRVQILN